MTDPIVLLGGFLAAAVRVATPLLLAATGETVTERSGVINLGLEGMMLAGALAAALGASAGGPWVGLAAGVLAGMVLAAAFAAIAIGARANQIIAGTAITLGAVGLTGTIYRQVNASHMETRIRSVADHDEVLRYLEAGNAAGAARAMRRHIQHRAQDLRQTIGRRAAQ